jgi:hypothetical protein
VADVAPEYSNMRYLESRITGKGKARADESFRRPLERKASTIVGVADPYP